MSYHESASEPAETLPTIVPTQPNLYLVQALRGKYLLNGSTNLNATIDLIEGSRYRFDLSDSSNANHPLRFSTTSNGIHGGGEQYTNGVTISGTPGSSGAFVDLVVESDTPRLYYFCNNHSEMGGQINTNAYLLYNNYTVDNSRNYNIDLVGNTNTSGFVVVGGDNYAVGNTITTIIVDYLYTGTSGADTLTGSKGANGNSWAHDFIDGGDGDDFLGGGGGRDVMTGGNGNDELRGGYGHDILDGGAGSDILYGGGGRNTFNNNNDGSIDQLFVLSDYHSHNQPTGRLHNGANADTISSLGVEDKITILGASTSELSIRQLTNGLGIFASGSLEAIVTDTSWNATSLANNVFGDATRYS